MQDQKHSSLRSNMGPRCNDAILLCQALRHKSLGDAFNERLERLSGASSHPVLCWLRLG